MNRNGIEGQDGETGLGFVSGETVTPGYLATVVSSNIHELTGHPARPPRLLPNAAEAMAGK